VLTALVTGAFWSVAAVVATDAAGPQRATRALRVMVSGVGPATVVGIPLGALVGQHAGRRGAFWGLAVLAAASALIIGRFVPAGHNPADALVGAQLGALRSSRLWLLLGGTVFVTGVYIAAFNYITPLITNKAGLPDSVVPLALAGYGARSLIGTNLAGRYADRAPLARYFSAATAAGVIMALIVLVAGAPAAAIALIVLLSVVGMAVPRSPPGSRSATPSQPQIF